MDPDDYDRNIHRPCPWASCNCTHTGCVSGWLDKSDDKGERAIPCPNCRPEVSAHFHRHGPSVRRLRSELPTLKRPSRTNQTDGPW
ncbi:MAG: hypothetical protein JWO11_4318 [Nocardioides sp.]|nr:hypothetical protein [Nocardioides sp.]